ATAALYNTPCTRRAALVYLRYTSPGPAQVSALMYPAGGLAAGTGRARAGDPAWTVGLAGIAMPGLRRAAGSLAAAYRGDPADLQSEVLTGFLAAVRALDLDDLESVPLASRL